MKRIVVFIGCVYLVVLAGCFSDEDGETAESGDATAITVAVPANELVANAAPPRGAEREFSTDFSLSLVDFSEVISGGPPKDGIPAINNPRFDSMADANTWVDDAEMVFIIDGRPYDSDEVHIYPVQILIYHEIANDRLGDTPITVTYCPLCNSALAFSGNVGEQTLIFGVSGRLRFSNMIMYDDKTESWWQQATGKAVVGELVGTRLEILPLLTVSWSEAKEMYTDAKVLSRDNGFRRPYGRNPYTGYDTLDHPFLFRGAVDPRQNPFERVVVGRVNGEEKPFVYSELERNVVTHDTIGGADVVLFWAPESASPLDSGTTSGGRVVGSANIFDTQLGSQALTFRARGTRIIDEQTNSEWSPLGVAVSGSLKGEQLRALPSIQHFWFSYAAFSDEG